MLENRRGADCFLRKPQPLSHVAEMVEALCREAAMRDKTEARTEADANGPERVVTTRGEIESGCNDYVTKPFSGVELLAKVKSCLGD